MTAGEPRSGLPETQTSLSTGRTTKPADISADDLKDRLAETGRPGDVLSRACGDPRASTLVMAALGSLSAATSAWVASEGQLPVDDLVDTAMNSLR